MPKINILRVKQYLALDADNHYVPAKEVQPGTDNLWRCPDCHCPVRLQDNIIGEEAWFEHFPPTKVTKADVSKCGYIRAEIRRQAFLLRLRALVDSMDTINPVTHWFCVWCNTHYQGEKHCKTCKTGIYSISRGDWSWNYNQPEGKSNSGNKATTAQIPPSGDR
ncbi:putative zinc ribbon protein [Kosakonia sp. YIM B13611]|uniref:putative zinc ribbon protein n=1 Tax=unclassified Kosakonia TaxID=2632876 RepID=UPI0036B701A2